MTNNQEIYVIIGAVCLILLTALLGVLAGFNLGEKISGKYRKKFKQKCKACDITYEELENTRAAVREKADEVIALKAKLCDERENSILLKSECEKIGREADRYSSRYYVASRVIIKHGLIDECNLKLKEKGLPKIEKTIFDDCIGEVEENAIR